MESPMKIDELYRKLYEKHKDMSNEELEDWWMKYQCDCGAYNGMGWIGFCVCEDILLERGIDYAEQFKP